MLVNTPYDDVFKTLSNDCSALLIPIINEAFHEHFIGNETIVFYPNEHFINSQQGQEQERITDTCFEILGEYRKKYHLECQSTTDSTMLVRMFEYDTQIALDDNKIDDSILTVRFPNSAILYLRSTSTTPDIMHIQMLTPGGELIYPIPTIKIKHYSLNDLFEKNLLFLIPFYIFVHENKFIEYNKDKKKLDLLLAEYEEIKNRLEDFCRQGKINEYVKCTIIDMSNKVLEHIARNYHHIQEGVKSVMGGKILEYEAKTILNRGRAEGVTEGIALGKIKMLCEMVRDGFISITEAAKRLNISVEEFQKHMQD